MVFGKVPEMDQKSEFAATLSTACAKVLVTVWMSKSGMVLAVAPASVPAMDRMMESARVLVMVVRCCDGSKVEFCKGSGDGFY